MHHQTFKYRESPNFFVAQEELISIFEDAELKIKKTVDGSQDPNLAATLVLYAATLLEASIKSIHMKEENQVKMACGVIRQTIRKTVGLEKFLTMMNDESMKAMDKMIDVADDKSERDSIYG